MKRPWIVLLLAAAAGCGPSTPRGFGLTPPPPVDNVSDVMLLSLPAAVNIDERPGADGIPVMVLLYDRARGSEPRPVNGALELLLFEGNLTGSDSLDAKPFQVWRFGGQDLRPRLSRSLFGWGYELLLEWGRRVPSSDYVTLAARYLPPKGGCVESSLVPIPMGSR